MHMFNVITEQLMKHCPFSGSRRSAVGTAANYELEERGASVRVKVKSRTFTSP
jgi:hypothetical protein